MDETVKNVIEGAVLFHSPWRLLSTTSLVLVLSSPAWAEDLHWQDDAGGRQAVSAVNGKIAAFGGDFGDGNIGGMSGALTLPLGTQFGMQFDGTFGSADDEGFYGIAAHLFWRDPARGLLGVYASRLSWDASSTQDALDLDGGFRNIDGAEVNKLGVEAEAYLDRISLEGLAAYQSGTDNGFAGKATVAFYALDNLRFDVSVGHLAGRGVLGSAGAEWQLPGANRLSLFADASVDDDSNWQALGGAKFYFGDPEKSLIRRHREDDPGLDLPDDLYLSIGKSRCPVGTHELSGFCDGVL